MYVYADTSAIGKLVTREPGTDAARRVWAEADGLATSSLTSVEIASGFSRATRDGRLRPDEATERILTLIELGQQLDIVWPGDPVINQAVELAFAYSLRGYDATHLASALLANADVLLSADAQLLEAAEQCGLDVADVRE